MKDDRQVSNPEDDGLGPMRALFSALVIYVIVSIFFAVVWLVSKSFLISILFFFVPSLIALLFAVGCSIYEAVTGKEW